MEISKITTANGLKIYVQHLTPALHECVAILRSFCFLLATQPPAARIASDTESIASDETIQGRSAVKRFYVSV